MDSPIATPRLFVLGGIELRGVAEDQAERLLTQAKAVALLVYLALAPHGRHQRRDRVVGLLWPELDQQHARTALRKAIHLIRAVLGPEVLIVRGDEEIALDPNALWCDVSDLRQSTDAGRLARAVDLYRGDLMPGFHLIECSEFDAWLEDQRTQAMELVVAAAWALAQHLEIDSKFTDAARMARHAARLAWTDERVLRRSLAMLGRLGDRAGALRLFEAFARRLRVEYESEPSAETLAAVAALRT